MTAEPGEVEIWNGLRYAAIESGVYLSVDMMIKMQLKLQINYGFDGLPTTFAQMCDDKIHMSFINDFNMLYGFNDHLTKRKQNKTR